MITINEIRIGNLISTDGAFCEVRAFDYNEITVKFIDEPEIAKNGSKLYDPIPLTPQWLIMLGFVHEEQSAPSIAIWDEYYHNKHNEFVIQLGGTYEFDKDFYYLGSCGKIYVKYVHQLQNLYYALSGTELTIN